MRNLLVVAALTLPAAVPAAPRLEPKAQFTTSEAEAYRVLIGPREVANTEMKVSFAVQGAKGATYTVELYVEADNTGEKAVFLRSTTVKLDGRPQDALGTASGEFRARYLFPGEAERPGQPPLPFRLSSRDWSYLLVLKDGKNIIASYGPGVVPFLRKDVRVPK